MSAVSYEKNKDSNNLEIKDSKATKKMFRLTYERRKALMGRLFVYPWVIGALVFFIYPLIQSFYLTFNDMTITNSGFDLKFVGMKHYLYAFTQDAYFLQYLAESLTAIFTNVPLVLLFSLFAAVLLNQKFKGRGFVRSVFFIPVLITSGALLYVLQGDINGASATGQQASGSMAMLQNMNIEYWLVQATNNAEWVQPIIKMMDSVFEVLWKSGVPILMFLAGLQSISTSLYESAKVDGATGWESFWKITVPMISPMIVINTVYVVIDTFTEYSNSTLRYILDTMFSKVQYGYGTAIAWVYFLIILVMLAVVLAIMNRYTFYSE